MPITNSFRQCRSRANRRVKPISRINWIKVYSNPRKQPCKALLLTLGISPVTKLSTAIRLEAWIRARCWVRRSRSIRTLFQRPNLTAIQLSFVRVALLSSLLVRHQDTRSWATETVWCLYQVRYRKNTTRSLINTMTTVSLWIKAMIYTSERKTRCWSIIKSVTNGRSKSLWNSLSKSKIKSVLWSWKENNWIRMSIIKPFLNSSQSSLKYSLKLKLRSRQDA